MWSDLNWEKMQHLVCGKIQHKVWAAYTANSTYFNIYRDDLIHWMLTFETCIFMDLETKIPFVRIWNQALKIHSSGWISANGERNSNCLFIFRKFQFHFDEVLVAHHLVKSLTRNMLLLGQSCMLVAFPRNEQITREIFWLWRCSAH